MIRIILLSVFVFEVSVTAVADSLSLGETRSQDFQQDEVLLTYAGSALWSFAYDIEINGDFAFCGMSNGIQAIDVSDPTNPRVVNQVYTGDQIRSIDIQGNKLFAGGNKLYIYNISEPLALILCGEYTCNGQIFSVKIRDDKAYLYYNNGFHIIDISDPAFCKHLGSAGISHESYWVADIELDGNWAYLATEQIYIFDISDPVNPFEVSCFITPYIAVDIEKADSLLFIVDLSVSVPATTSSIVILNVMNPQTPEYLGDFEVQGVFGRIKIIEEYAYVGAGINGFGIYNISDPNNLTLTGCYIPKGKVGSFAIRDSMVIMVTVKPSITESANPEQTPCGVGDLSEGNIDISSGQDSDSSRIEVINISDKSNPFLLGRIPQVGYCNSVTIANGYAIVCSDQGYINILDISAADTILPVSRIITPRAGNEIALRDNILLAANKIFGLRIYDITDIQHPTLLKTITDLGMLNDIHVRGSYAFISGQNGFKVLDISNPLEPQISGGCDIPDLAAEFIILGQYAYVTGRYSGFHIVDISDPSNPFIAASSSETFWNYNIAYKNNIIFLSSEHTISIYDISIPLSPQKLCDVTPYVSIQDIAIYGDFIVATGGPDANVIYDFSNPSTPKEIIRFETPVISLGADASKEHIYICDYLSVIRFALSSYTDIEDNDESGFIPSKPILFQNRPNPFNNQTVISYYLDGRSYVELVIYNILGQPVKTFMQNEELAGYHHFYWDGTNNDGFKLSSGIYIYDLRLETKHYSKKMLYLK